MIPSANRLKDIQDVTIYSLNALMLEMSYPCEDHSHVMFITKVDRVLVFDGSSGLNHCLNSRLACYLHAVGKWKESV